MGARLIEGLLPSDLRGFVQVSSVDPRGFSNQEMFGGMEAHTAGGFSCTTGWAVRDGVGDEGVTTAAHCSGITSVVDPGVGTEGAFMWAEHLGAWGDIEWEIEDDGDYSQLDNFYSNATTIRDTTAVEPIAGVSVGESICVYGRAGNTRRCTTVNNVSVSCLNANRLIRAAASVTIGGDSGAGWSWNNTAFGGHKGMCSSLSVFSAADYFDEAIGVSVMTSP